VAVGNEPAIIITTSTGITEARAFWMIRNVTRPPRGPRSVVRG